MRSLLRIKRYTDELDSAESVIVSLALTIEARDGTTDGHCQRLAHYASALGRALGLDADDVSALRARRLPPRRRQGRDSRCRAAQAGAAHAPMNTS